MIPFNTSQLSSVPASNATNLLPLRVLPIYGVHLIVASLFPVPGIPEGTKDLPSGIALPLESNLAYMNGISFTKGCYIGQELTARTHHMGVIRKRLLPIQLSTSVPSESIPEGAEIVTESGKSAGKYRAGDDKFGIALLRMAHINGPLHLKVPDDTPVSLSTSIPAWWPKPANK